MAKDNAIYPTITIQFLEISLYNDTFTLLMIWNIDFILFLQPLY